MATNVSNYKSVAATFGNAQEWQSFTYDFAVEGGATGDYDLFIAAEDLVITRFYADIQTAVTSGGSLTANLGSTSPSATTAIWSAKAVAAMALDAVLPMDTSSVIRIASGGKIRFTIAAAAALTGKIVFNFLLKRQ